ncbi:27636_t:CDS:1, partial [Gigaspora margarita]
MFQNANPKSIKKNCSKIKLPKNAHCEAIEFALKELDSPEHPSINSIATKFE